MTLSRSSVLFYNDFASGPEPEVGGELSFARDSAGWSLGRDGLFHRARAGQYSYVWMDLAGKVSEPPFRRPLFSVMASGETLVRGNQTDIGTAWSQTATYDKTQVPSIFAGGEFEAWKVIQSTSSLGSMFHEWGTFTGSREVVIAIVEQAPEGGDTIRVRVRDNTVGTDNLGQVSYVFSTDTVDALGSPATNFVGRLPLGYGPSGGLRVLLYAGYVGTSGNSRQAKLLPTDEGIGTGVIVHYYDIVEENGQIVFPLPSAGGTTYTQDTEDVSFAQVPAPQDMISYLAMVPLTTQVGFNRYWTLGRSGGPRLILQGGNAGGRLRVYFDDGANVTTVLSTSGLFAPDDYVEAAVIVHNATGDARLVVRTNGVGAAGASSSAGTWNPPAAWQQDALYLCAAGSGAGSQTSDGSALFDRLYFARLGDVDAATDGTDDSALMDELSAFHLDTGANA